MGRSPSPASSLAIVPRRAAGDWRATKRQFSKLSKGHLVNASLFAARRAQIAAAFFLGRCGAATSGIDGLPPDGEPGGSAAK